MNCVIVQFLEKCPDSALEFPSILDGAARAQIHCVCNFLGIASHSQGSSGRNRRIIVYQKHLYQDKQLKEAADAKKERAKIMAKLKESNFPP